jgi:tetratricopeptide (TPR) repeat protein
MKAELLARVVELKDDSGGWDVGTAQEWLESIRDLSFIKIHPEDDRFFLHDEMYEMLDRHLLAYVSERRHERFYRAILDYYQERILDQRERVAVLWTPRKEESPKWDRTELDQPRPPDEPAELAQATSRLYNLMAEEIYYRLRKDPLDGFRTYQVYAREAFWASEESLERLLRSEMLQFLSEHRDEVKIDGLKRDEIEIDMALRRLERINRAHDPFAVTYARQIREECQDLLDRAGSLSRVRLTFLEGEALIHQGRSFPQAEDLLKQVINTLQTHDPQTVLGKWQSPIFLAEAYNYLGYLYRTLGWFKKAIVAYSEAVVLWRLLEEREEDGLRRLALRAQHANTLNNQAWAMAERGHFLAATQTCQDALDMRKMLGPRAPVAFSLNILGMILTRDDKPHRARVHCQRALGIFRDLEQTRGIGLASIALAEAFRRMSMVPDLYAPEEEADLLQRAVQHSTDSVEIFGEGGPVPERPRLVEALIERGCAYRQWAWLRPLYISSQDPEQDELIDFSKEDLDRAIALAGDDLLYRSFDAQVNLGWLYYFTRQLDEAEQEARRAIGRVGEEYLITADEGLPDTSLPNSAFFVQLGKVYLLLGEVAGSRFLDEDNREALREVGKYYTLSMAYNDTSDFHNIQRGAHRMYVRLKKLNLSEFELVHEGMQQAIDEYHLSEPTRMDRFLVQRLLPQRPESA